MSTYLSAMWELPPVSPRLRQLSSTYTVTITVAAGLIVGVIVAASLAASHVEEAMADRSAAAAALYMDNFLEAEVQELSTRDSLSDQRRAVSERLLSPVSIGRPVVGFRIWVGDRLVFGNDRNLIGNLFAGTAAGRRAAEEYVAADLDGAESEDDAQIRDLAPTHP